MESLAVERRGLQLEKMMQSDNPHIAIQLLHDFDLLSLLFNISPKVKELMKDPKV